MKINLGIYGLGCCLGISLMLQSCNSCNRSLGDSTWNNNRVDNEISDENADEKHIEEVPASASSADLINTFIEKMGKQRWDAAAYTGIVKNIREYVKNADSLGLQAKLNKVYCDVMVREARNIFRGSCEDEHERLKSVISEMKRFPKRPDMDSVLNMYLQHNSVLDFIEEVRVSKQKFSHLGQKYDRSYDRKILQERSRYDSLGYSCKAIVRGLKKIPFYLDNRQARFVGDVVKFYLTLPEYKEGYENIVRVCIDAYRGAAEKKAKWEKQLEEFKTEKLQPKDKE